MGSAKGRYLLSEGTTKMGRTIFAWSIPAVSTCPGSTPCCRDKCYATKSRFATKSIKRLLQWKLAQSKSVGFVERMVDELFRRGVMVCRIHVAGDFYHADYVNRWIEIASRSPKVRFFGYTRSWRESKIETALRAFSECTNVRLWYSADRDTGFPTEVPPGVRVAWLQTSATESVAGDLVFRTRELRKLELPLVVPVCEHETLQGRAKGIVCANCRLCFE